MAISEGKATEILKKHGVPTPSKAMVEDLQDQFERKNMSTESDIYAVIGKHARASIKEEAPAEDKSKKKDKKDAKTDPAE